MSLQLSLMLLIAFPQMIRSVASGFTMSFLFNFDLFEKVIVVGEQNHHLSGYKTLNDLFMQVLEFRLFNIPHGTQPLRGRLPLTPGSSLRWFGFSEEGRLCSYDSKVLNVFTVYTSIDVWYLFYAAYGSCSTADSVNIICRVC